MAYIRSIDQHFRPAVYTVVNFIFDDVWMRNYLMEAYNDQAFGEDASTLELQQAIIQIRALLRFEGMTYDVNIGDSVQRRVHPGNERVIFRWTSVTLARLAVALYDQGDLTEDELHALYRANDQLRERNLRKMALQPRLTQAHHRRLDWFRRRIETLVNDQFPNVRTRKKSSRYDK